MKLIFPFHKFLNAWLNFTERDAQIVSRTEAIASLGLLLTTISAENPCLQRYVVESGSRILMLRYQLLAFPF